MWPLPRAVADEFENSVRSTADKASPTLCLTAQKASVKLQIAINVARSGDDLHFETSWQIKILGIRKSTATLKSIYTFANDTLIWCQTTLAQGVDQRHWKVNSSGVVSVESKLATSNQAISVANQGPLLTPDMLLWMVSHSPRHIGLLVNSQVLMGNEIEPVMVTGQQDSLSSNIYICRIGRRNYEVVYDLSAHLKMLSTDITPLGRIDLVLAPVGN
jgi:hypothetical protein